MKYFIVVWLLAGIWRAYKFLKFDIRDEGHVSWGHVTFSLLLIIGGLISLLDHYIHLEVLYGYTCVDDVDEWYNRDNGNWVKEVNREYTKLAWSRLTNKEIMDKYMPVEIIGWGTINKIFRIYPDLNRRLPTICRYMTRKEYTRWRKVYTREMIDIDKLLAEQGNKTES